MMKAIENPLQADVSIDNDIHLLTQQERLKAVIYSHRMAVLSVTIAICTLFISVSINLTQWIYVRHTHNTYFATTNDGRIFQLMPLSVPIQSDNAVAGFAGRAITDTFTFDYVNYKKSMASVANNYTPAAFTEIKQNLAGRDGLVRQAKTNSWIVTATLMSAPQLVNKGFLPNTKTYAWRLIFPAMLTFQTENETSSERYTADVTVVRVDQKNNPRGIAIAKLSLTAGGQS